MTRLRFRQIHLDFHTSEAIGGIGSKFDPDRFADTLKAAHVNSVTCFGRCHHGWIYYDTKAFPERRHPHLERNLLVEQIQACHARDIRVPVYITVQWDQYTSERHPEWLGLDANGKQLGTAPYEAGFYRRLLVNSPYMDFLKFHVKELFDLMPVDGLFFDIVQPLDDSSYWARRGMLEKGMDPADEAQRKQFGIDVINAFKTEMSAFCRAQNPDSTIFYNAGHIGPRHRATADAYSHFELESLPSGGWGYVHFPMAVRYARTLGQACLGMTGKFHTSWGDFHSFKNEEALQFECYQMLAHGAQCSVGDQLHPEGEICPTTYGLIGSVYEEVEKKEPWCVDAEPLVDIGVFSVEEFTGERIPQAMAGVVRLLQEGGHQFDIIDSQADLSNYGLVILPDSIRVDDAFGRKLEAYVDGGGKLIASHRSGLDPAGDRFGLACLGVTLEGDAPFSPDFIVPGDAVSAGLPKTEHAMYMKGMEVRVEGAEVLAEALVPYFNRTWEHFCSHRHTPSEGKAGYPAIARNGGAVYFAHPVFTQYYKNAPRWVKRLVLNAIELLLPEPLVRLAAPTTTIATINRQAAKERHVLHLLHYVPERRGADFDVIEDVIPIFDVGVSIRHAEAVTSVTLVPGDTSIEYTQEGGRLSFTVPRVDGHQMVEIR